MAQLEDGARLIRDSETGQLMIIKEDLDEKGSYKIVKEIGEDEDPRTAIREYLGIGEEEEETSEVQAICGNQILEEGEECDIGELENCNYLEDVQGWGWHNMKKYCQVNVEENDTE